MDISMDKDQTCVIVIDVQGDFTLAEHGSLAVQGTDPSYIKAVIAATRQLKDRGFKILATQDFHPRNHISFYTNHKNKNVYDIIEIEGRTQILWPPHCVQGTQNVELLMENDLFSSIIPKGMDVKYDSYSGFFDDNGSKTGLDNVLKSYKANTLILYGLATDYCVKATAMDAVKLGYEVILLEDLCKGVAEDTTLSALKEMKVIGIKIVSEVSDILG